MMWITEYRKRNGIELDGFARMVNKVGRATYRPWEITVSDTLIHYLEVMKVPRTHPKIADAIATVCGATKEQRDSIVDERYRGTWEPQQCAEIQYTASELEKINVYKNLKGGGAGNE